jgi:hypothetical protein
MFTECGPVFLTKMLISLEISSVKSAKIKVYSNLRHFLFYNLSKLTKNIDYSEFHVQILLILQTGISI